MLYRWLILITAIWCLDGKETFGGLQSEGKPNPQGNHKFRINEETKKLKTISNADEPEAARVKDRLPVDKEERR